ncbi:MAG: succinylglutamate desuccinylase/aspartoacylase family protein [Pseudomonadota bacterium]
MTGTPTRFQFKSTSYAGLDSGARLIVTGAVHGNETCGTAAILRVIDAIDSGALSIAAGTVTFVPVANPLAYARRARAGERNLNRNLFPNTPRDFEDHVANWLCPLLAAHDVLLDLHSFSAAGQPFALLGPHDNNGALEPFAHAAREVALARRLGVRRFVDGWLAAYARGVERRLEPDARAQALRFGVGTTEYMRRCGGYALTLECGQHGDPGAVELAYRAILATLAFTGLIDAAAQPVAPDQVEALSLTDVVDKVDAGDVFERPWASFDVLHQGQRIGTRANGTPVLAPADGFIVFPDAQAGAGQEWFYLAQPNLRFAAP